MGCSPGDPECEDSERPAHTVTVKPFLMGIYVVTFAQWDTCMAEGACREKPDDQGWGRGNYPVINVSWDDAQQYVAWASSKSGRKIRLPTEAEWEYVCRAGNAQDKYCGGGNVDLVAWNYRNSYVHTHPVGQKQDNRWGLHDMSGNGWEWTQDCWNETYNDAPPNGSAWTLGDCGRRVFRGGSWYIKPWGVRSSVRSGFTPDYRDSSQGFRLVQDE
ncbi:MAG: formylglycine-generating enzyme family protein [Gammaproteobacteria bacterium]|nr:formylglycine-generating enzyme family protein [Gammaproteobacteria bacterium]